LKEVSVYLNRFDRRVVQQQIDKLGRPRLRSGVAFRQVGQELLEYEQRGDERVASLALGVHSTVDSLW
jgi:hypothetical protein